MKRSTRADLARQTVEIVDRGEYQSPSGRLVSIADEVQACLDGTELLDERALERLRVQGMSATRTEHRCRIEVADETTLAGVARLLVTRSAPVVALNFASAKNPGGGFLNGAEAQEESLARSSALYASQLVAPAFYERHRASPSLLYSHTMILSPDCPIFRDDTGQTLEVPHLAGFITSAAPNKGAAQDTRRHEVAAVPEILERRAEYVLALAVARGYRRIVLGAWGCGVFRNDPEVVAKSFARHLAHDGPWSGQFDEVVFSIFDPSRDKSTLATFQSVLG